MFTSVNFSKPNFTAAQGIGESDQSLKQKSVGKASPLFFPDSHLLVFSTEPRIENPKAGQIFWSLNREKSSFWFFRLRRGNIFFLTNK